MDGRREREKERRRGGEERMIEKGTERGREKEKDIMADAADHAGICIYIYVYKGIFLGQHW